jgi:general L-amino acid transport system substrate-binding protein
MKRSIILAALAVLIIPAAGGTIDEVRSRGVLNCGVNGNFPGFSDSDSRGRWTGFEVDYCRAYAAAILNDSEKVKYVKVAGNDRFIALKSGYIDVLLSNTTWSNEWEAQFDLLATGSIFFDGQ